MAAVGQTHAQHGVAGLEQGEKGCQIGVGTGMRLDVGVIAAEQLAGPLTGQLLGDVHGAATAVILLTGIALGVFIGQAGALRQHHRLADDVLRRDQLNVAAFPGKFLLNGSAQFRIVLGEILHGLLKHNKVFLCWRILHLLYESRWDLTIDGFHGKQSHFREKQPILST